MDLTTSFPSSVRDTMLGVVMLPRTTDKAKAKAHGNIGEYHYDCPLDKTVFGFLGIDAAEFLSTVTNAKSDADIEAFVKPYVEKKSHDEISAYNHGTLSYGPAKGSEGEPYFLQTRDALDASRTDITAWADLLDLEEKRDVPHRALA